MRYHFWEKTAEPLAGESVAEPPTQEEPRSDPMTTPPVSQPEPQPDPQAEEKHKLDLESQEQALRHKEELHEQRLRHTEELHALKMQTQGTPSGSTPQAQAAPAPMMTPQQSQSNLLANYIQAKMGEAMCATPGKKIRSKGKGRGKAVGEGKGPIGRMADAVKAAFEDTESPEEEEREEAAGNPVTMDQVKEFLRQNQTPEDSELHQWAESLGVSPSAAEELIYQLAAQQVTGKPPEETVEGGPEEEEKAAKELIPGGEAEGKPDSAYPADQLRQGIKVEKEHTPDPRKAKEIAKDHLEEHSQYYTALDAMEAGLEAKKASWHELKAEISEYIQARS